jgi:hypothetical protein
MMTATEAMEQRLAEEKKQQGEVKPAVAEPTPTSPGPAPAPAAEKPAAAAKPTTVKPATSTQTSRYTVAITLDPHVHAHFQKKADQDDRTLAKYLQRFLRTQVTPPAGSEEKF